MDEDRTITEDDWLIINQFLNGMGKLADLSNNIKRQGWISSKQRTYMNSLYNSWKQSNNKSYGFDVYSDFTEEDYQITNYELCVGEWGE
jgi:hypothetical protein